MSNIFEFAQDLKNSLVSQQDSGLFLSVSVCHDPRWFFPKLCIRVEYDRRVSEDEQAMLTEIMKINTQGFNIYLERGSRR